MERPWPWMAGSCEACSEHRTRGEAEIASKQAGGSMIHRLTIAVHPGFYAICRLDPKAEMPSWVPRKGFCSITRTAEELSIVCEEHGVPADAPAERGRRLLRIEGTLPFSLAGVVASVASPLAEAQISLFVIATYDTDYLLIREGDLERAVATLESSGHTVRRIS